MRGFICYRRDDSRFVAHLLGEFLRERLGRSNVFVDVVDVVAGEDIWPRIAMEITRSSFVIALIGPHWEPGRLSHSEDYVFRELKLALDLGIPIIPAVHSDVAPREVLADLPAELRPLAGRNVLVIPEPPRHVLAFEVDLARSLKVHVGEALPAPRPQLAGLDVGLSTSEPDSRSDESDIDLVRYTIVAAAERMLAEGASITYGGLPAVETSQGWNVTRRLQDLAADFPGQVTNYALRSSLPAAHRFYGGIVLAPHEPRRRLDPSLSASAVMAVSLMDLRQALIDRTVARVCIGGRTTGYVGRMPGVMEEVACALAQGQPVYLLGGFGGATTEMALLAGGQRSDVVTLEFQQRANGNNYRDLVAELARQGLEPCYEELRVELARGPSVLNNGLSASENDALLTTTHWRRAFELLVTGLGRVDSR